MVPCFAAASSPRCHAATLPPHQTRHNPPQTAPRGGRPHAWRRHLPHLHIRWSRHGRRSLLLDEPRRGQDLLKFYIFTIYLLFTTSVDNVGSALSRPDLGPDLGSTLAHTILPSSVQFIGKLAPDVAEDKQKLKESA